jgi:hypothetical protein
MTALSKTGESTAGSAYLGDGGAGVRGRTGAGLVGPRDIKSLGNAGLEWHFNALYLTLLPQTVFDASLKCG